MSSEFFRVHIECIFNSIKNALIILDTGMHVVLANHSFYNHFKVTPEETEGRLIYDIRNGQWNIPGLHDLLETIIPGNQSVNILEVKHRFDSIGERIMLFNVRRLQCNTDTPVMVLLTIEDITSLHFLQDRLKRERKFVSAILQTSGALITVVDKNGAIVRFNRACEKLTGFSMDEVYKRPIIEFIPKDEREGVKKVIERLFSGESPVEYENHWVTRYGTKHFIRWQNSILHDKKNNVEFVIATGIDISDWRILEIELNKRAEELSVAIQDLESFSFSISHDLRGPLATIGGFVNILIEDYAERLDKDGNDYLRRMKNDVRKTQELIIDILDMSRVGRCEMKREHVNLSHLVREYLNELTTQASERKVECVVQDNVYADADPRMIHIALENLLRNAWKFTAKRADAHIMFGCEEKNGKAIYYVKDNGVGFDMQFAEAIFKPFKRGHSEKEFSGTGIGLSIVKRAVQRHTGEVWAEGEVGKGATFYFTLE